MKNAMQEHGFSVPAKLYRIGELVRYTPFSRQTIHNYTIMGLIQESEWTQGGHRLYDETVFERLSRILELRKTMTLTQIRKVLSKESGASAGQSTADNNGLAADGRGDVSHFESN